MPRERRLFRAHPLLNDGDWLRRQYLGQGRSTASIASDLGVVARTVRLALADHDIPIRRRGRRNVLDAAAEVEVVRRYAAGHSMRAVALMLDVGEDTIRETLLRRGVPIRGRGGRRPADSAMPPQLRDTQWLSDRRLEGLSIRQIAASLGVSGHAVANALRGDLANGRMDRVSYRPPRLDRSVVTVVFGPPGASPSLAVVAIRARADWEPRSGP